MKSLIQYGTSLTLLAAAAGAQVRISAPIRMDNAPGTAMSNELTQSASYASPLIGISGWNDYRVGVRSIFGLTLDGGETWTEHIIRPPNPYKANVEGDPMGCYDHRTGTLWAGGMAFAGNGGVYSARLDPGNTTFEPTKMIDITGSADKGWMAAGADPNNPNLTRVYCSYNLGTTRSTDMGDTWSNPVNLGTGTSWLPRVGPSGTLYVAYYNFGTLHRLRKSTNGGVSFGSNITIAVRMDTWNIQDCPQIPGSFRAPSFHGFAVDPNDETLYCVYPDTTAVAGGNSDVDIYFTMSTNLGNSWSTPKVINGDSPFVGDQWFPWIEVDEQGRLHVLYFDSRHVNQNDNASSCVFDAYYALSTDKGATWSEHRLTPSSFDSQDDGFNDGFIGDYLGMSVGGNRAIPTYLITDPGSKADAYCNEVLIGPGQEYCRGIFCPCGNDDPLRGCGNLGNDGNAATGAELSATAGSPSIAADDIVLTATGLQGNALGFLFVGSDTQSQVNVGDGRLCVSGLLFRYPVQQANGAGTLTFGPNYVIANAANFPPAGQPQPGETWNYQVYLRDVGGPCGSTFNTTNGVSVTWDN